MSRSFRIAYFAHTVRSDWNNGNAHFLRGLLRSLGELGHEVTIFEPDQGWSITNLKQEPSGQSSLTQFAATYPSLRVTTYDLANQNGLGLTSKLLRGVDIVIVHEWNPPELVHRLLAFREQLV